MAKRRLPDLADDHRCTRNGTNWRCHLPRLPGKSYCQKHHLFNLARSQSRSKSKSQFQTLTLTPTPNPALLREIWAFHHPSPDGRPRLYARVERRIPNQSLVEVTPLLPYPNPAAEAACGLFKATDSRETKEMGMFSHRVWFEIGGSEGELYKIFPRKGEVWAVEEYGGVEMMTSFGDVEGASGIVLEVEEGEVVFRRRLYEGCELIRRFSMEEMGMFSHRISGARVLGVGEGLLLQGCVLENEAENETSLQRQVTICRGSEACNNVVEENIILEQAPDPIDNEGENALTSEGVSTGADAYEITLRGTESVSVVEENHQPEISSKNSNEVSGGPPVESTCK